MCPKCGSDNVLSFWSLESQENYFCYECGFKMKGESKDSENNDKNEDKNKVSSI